MAEPWSVRRKDHGVYTHVRDRWSPVFVVRGGAWVELNASPYFDVWSYSDDTSPPKRFHHVGWSVQRTIIGLPVTYALNWTDYRFKLSRLSQKGQRKNGWPVNDVHIQLISCGCGVADPLKISPSSLRVILPNLVVLGQTTRTLLRRYVWKISPIASHF